MRRITLLSHAVVIGGRFPSGSSLSLFLSFFFLTPNDLVFGDIGCQTDWRSPERWIPCHSPHSIPRSRTFCKYPDRTCETTSGVIAETGIDVYSVPNHFSICVNTRGVPGRVVAVCDVCIDPSRKSSSRLPRQSVPRFHRGHRRACELFRDKPSRERNGGPTCRDAEHRNVTPLRRGVVQRFPSTKPRWTTCQHETPSLTSISASGTCYPERR
jgi:hypothetical protein